MYVYININTHIHVLYTVHKYVGLCICVYITGHQKGLFSKTAFWGSLTVHVGCNYEDPPHFEGLGCPFSWLRWRFFLVSLRLHGLIAALLCRLSNDNSKLDPPKANIRKYPRFATGPFWVFPWPLQNTHEKDFQPKKNLQLEIHCVVPGKMLRSCSMHNNRFAFVRLPQCRTAMH